MDASIPVAAGLPIRNQLREYGGAATFTMPVSGGRVQEMNHYVRHAERNFIITGHGASAVRTDMQGLRKGLNFTACRRYISNPRTSPWNAGTYMMIGSGGFLGRDRKCRHLAHKGRGRLTHTARARNVTKIG